MLVLTQTTEDAYTLTIPPGDRERVVTIKTLEIRRDRVRHGIVADRDIAIVRDNAVDQGPRTGGKS